VEEKIRRGLDGIGRRLRGKYEEFRASIILELTVMISTSRRSFTGDVNQHLYLTLPGK
jgi:hypothetical protein